MWQFGGAQTIIKTNQSKAGQETDWERIRKINHELHEQTDPSDADQKYWKALFQTELADGGRHLTKEQLLGSHDAWLMRLKQSLPEERMLEFDREVVSRKHPTTEAFIAAVTRFFDIHELYQAEVI